MTWINANGEILRDEDWQNDRMLCFGMLMDGRARPTGVPQRGVEATLLLILNSHHEIVEFILPAHAEAVTWELMIDTNIPELADRRSFAASAAYGVTDARLLFESG